jgi:hypothetical protein
MELISFIPQTAAYKIFYPTTYLLDEAEDGIVSITSPDTDSNLTLSGYQVNQRVTEDILKKLFADVTEGYEAQSELRTLPTNQDFHIEQTFFNNGVNWIWWGLSKENQIILISINSRDKLTDADYNLYRFMVDQMDIYPDEPDDA